MGSRYKNGISKALRLGLKLIISIAAIVFIMIGVPLAIADSGQFVNVILSNSCIAAHAANFSTACPTYDDLIQFDTSIQKYSGNFIYPDNGTAYREISPYTNSYKLYSIENKWRVFVDPPFDMYHLGRLITIEPSVPLFSPSDDSLKEDRFAIKVRNVTRVVDGEWITEQREVQVQVHLNQEVYHKDRDIDKHCRSASISAQQYETLLPDTIQYLSSNCNANATQIDLRVFVSNEPDPVNLSDSPAYQKLKYWQELALKCSKSYGAC